MTFGHGAIRYQFLQFEVDRGDTYRNELKAQRIRPNSLYLQYGKEGYTVGHKINFLCFRGRLCFLEFFLAPFVQQRAASR